MYRGAVAMQKIHFVTHSMGGKIVRYYLKYRLLESLEKW